MLIAYFARAQERGGGDRARRAGEYHRSCVLWQTSHRHSLLLGSVREHEEPRQ